MALDHGLSCFSPAPGRTDGKIYYFVPENIDLTQPAALLVFMHGGDANSPETAPFDTYLDPEKGTLRPHIDHCNFIVAAASAPVEIDGKRWNRSAAVKALDAIIADAQSRTLIDHDRIIIGGHSMGGFGAYHLGQIYADRAAGVWLSAGAWQISDFRSLYGTGVYILHGKYDCASNYREFHKEPRHHDWCGVSFGRAAHQLMTRYGVEHIYDEHDGGHGLRWEPAQMALRRFLTWAESQKRDPYATKTALITPRGSADPELSDAPKARYLELLEAGNGTITYDKIHLTGPNIAWTIDDLVQQNYELQTIDLPGSRIIAENLGNNHFAVSVENVKTFVLYLAPQMGDLHQPFVIDCGSDGTFTRNAEMLDEPDADYCARIIISLT
ncbi:MAG: hypothetical protein E7053_03205 [Lentisphaerae bacterium]|nr:hypothetical protein [Lentisphaerota bacterium]